jgi:signal transduction histidine kinase
MAMNDDDLGRMNQVLRHRLRNLASGIKAAVAFLARDLDGQLSEAHKEYFPLINAECDGISEITARLNLLFDAIPTGATGMLGEILDKLETALRQRFPTAVFGYEVDDRLRGMRVASSQGLRVALEEIMANAIEETPRKGIVLRGEEKKGKLALAVEDQGKGVNESDMDRIFLPFFTARPRHLGLGLAIARRMVSPMGGTIRAISRKPTGLIVSISLPLNDGMAGSV